SSSRWRGPAARAGGTRCARFASSAAATRHSLLEVDQRAEAAEEGRSTPDTPLRETTRVEQPETCYARSGDVSIALQVLGDGPFDLVCGPGFVSHVELRWTVPSFARSLRELASFSRLILFDKRGTGMSDRVAGAPTLETRMDDLRAVMDAVGSRRAAV